MAERMKHGTTITLTPGTVVSHAGFKHDQIQMEVLLERIEDEREVQVDFHWIKRKEIDIVCSCDMTRTGFRSRCMFRDKEEESEDKGAIDG